MQRYVAAGLAVLASAGGAFAEEKCFDKGTLTYFDCPVEAEEVAIEPAPAAVPTFTGFYLGAHIGAGATDLEGLFDSGGDETVLDDTGIGPLAGVQFGYLYQFENNFVLGVEVDASAGNVSAEVKDDLEDGVFEEIDGSVQFAASARLRAGYAFERFMPFLTAGVGVVGFDFDLKDNDETPEPDDSFSYSEEKFATVFGGGVEYMVTDTASLRIEGLYYAFDDKFGIGDVDLDDVDDGDFVAVEDLWSVRAALSFKF